MINKNNFFVFAVTLMPLTLVFICMPLLLLIALRSNDNLPGYIFPEEHFDFFIVLVGIFTAVLIGLYVVAVRKFGEYVETEYEAKRAVENLKQIKQLVDSSRKQRHDFYHQLQTVYGLLEGGFFDRARNYINRMFSSVSRTGVLIKTDNFTISALLYTKIGLAEARNIDLEITVDCSLKELPLTPLESSSLLGNLIDNALEAVEEKTGEHRQVKLEITIEHGVYVIACANGGDPIAPEIRENIFKPDFTTKEGHSGLGLAIVKDIVNKYRGAIHLNSDGHNTTFTVTIPVSLLSDDVTPL